jgi:hypothetical protein
MRQEIEKSDIKYIPFCQYWLPLHRRAGNEKIKKMKKKWY